MTDNDYIAEYVREKYPSILGIDFVIWRMGKAAANALREMADCFSHIDQDELKKKAEGENE